MDDQQRASREQFDRQAGRYGKGHILEETDDVDRLMVSAGLEYAPGPNGAVGEALDVACGGGHCARRIAQAGYRVTIADISPHMLEATRRLLAAHGLQPAQSVEAPAEELPVAAARFDLVTTRVAPHHFSDPAQFVREGARVLKPGGTLLVIDGSVAPDEPEAEDWLNAVEKERDPSHGRFLSATKWRSLAVEAGLEVVALYLEPMRQPDLRWYLDAAGAGPERRQRVFEMIDSASDRVRRVMEIERTAETARWTWRRVHMAARKRAVVE